MTFEHPISVQEIAAKIGAEIIGDDRLMATGINEIHQVRPGDITFVDVSKYFQKSLSSAATVVILNERTECPPGKVLLLCDKPFEAYNGIVLEHRPLLPQSHPVSDTATIHPTAIIGPNVVIGHHVYIGAHTRIEANAVIGEYSILGSHVAIGPGALIGSDAFYYKKTAEGFQKWRSGGRVVIEDEVDIGAGCTICKGVSGDTVIGRGAKLDCQVHIGHDAVLGQHCLLAGQVGIGGNTVLEDGVVLYGQVGIAQNLRIGKGAVVLAKSGVSKDIPAGKVFFGIPASEARVAYREMAALRQLPDMLKRKE